MGCLLTYKEWLGNPTTKPFSEEQVRRQALQVPTLRQCGRKCLVRPGFMRRVQHHLGNDRALLPSTKWGRGKEFRYDKGQGIRLYVIREVFG